MVSWLINIYKAENHCACGPIPFPAKMSFDYIFPFIIMFLTQAIPILSAYPAHGRVPNAGFMANVLRPEKCWLDSWYGSEAAI